MVNHRGNTDECDNSDNRKNTTGNASDNVYS